MCCVCDCGVMYGIGSRPVATISSPPLVFVWGWVGGESGGMCAFVWVGCVCVCVCVCVYIYVYMCV